MFLSLVDLIIKRPDLAEYVDYRRQHINPAMRATGAFLGTQLLATLEEDTPEGSMRCVLINRWRSLEVQRRFASSDSHAAHLAAMKALAPIRSVQSLERLDGLSFGDHDYDPTLTCVIERHRCHPGRSAAYVAAWANVRSSVGEVPECVAVAVCADIADRDSFVAMYWWTSESAANDYFAQVSDGSVATPTRDIVAEGLGSAVRYCDASRIEDVATTPRSWGTSDPADSLIDR